MPLQGLLPLLMSPRTKGGGMGILTAASFSRPLTLLWRCGWFWSVIALGEHKKKGSQVRSLAETLPHVLVQLKVVRTQTLECDNGDHVCIWIYKTKPRHLSRAKRHDSATSSPLPSALAINC